MECAGGFGVAVQDGASVVADGLLVEDNRGPGAYMVSGGSVTARDAALLRNGFAGAVLFGGRLDLEDSEISGSVVHASEGGSVSVFAWDRHGPADVDLHAVSFSDLGGPALYLRGPGRFAVRGCTVTDAGTLPWLPGGVLALEGVGPWMEMDDDGELSGLMLAGNSFDGLASDAILLDHSSATLDYDSETGDPNTFGTLEGAPLLWQRRGDAEIPQILDGSVPPPACEPVPVALGPALEYRLWLAEVDPIE